MRRDDGSLPLAMLLTLVGVMLSGLLVPVVLNQVGSTRHVLSRTRAGGAAAAGLQVALAHLRSATSGRLTDLPCGPLTGQVSAGGTARYQVTIDYLATDPYGRSDAWIADNRLPCAPGTGPAGTPRYASLVALGTNEAAGAFSAVRTRRIRATYPLRLAQAATSGGAIRVGDATAGAGWCLDAQSATPGAGTALLVQVCVQGSAQQAFSYHSNLTLVLVSSQTAALPLGMCIDAGRPHSPDAPARLTPCQATTAPQQQWTFNTFGNFEGTADGTNPDGFCLTVRTPGQPGSPVVLDSAEPGMCNQPASPAQTFAPDPGVGTGAAGAEANQLVNYQQYSRCLGVTGGNVAAAYLVAFPCTQAPDPETIPWPQRWAIPIIDAGTSSGTNVIAASSPSGRVCLRSPGSPGPGRYVTLAPCPAGPGAPELTWTVFSDTGTYATSYQVIDGFGNCLTPTDLAASPADLHPGIPSTSKIIVSTCDGSSDQKWNATPNLLTTTSLRNIEER